ncbi:kelch-like protein 12 [Plakobranchus ocellatus]|uniref:Kelch-like protein 12 n=1 Tax=Plakobranchus ocellatus TaxID=259542 RepID=A0AAV4DV27_9GAST|nr:kelch-like protein 12 [Plakobranchus ocellatus]
MYSRYSLSHTDDSIVVVFQMYIDIQTRCGVSVSLVDCTDDSIVVVFQMYIDIQARCGVSVSLMDCTDDSIVVVFQMYIDIQARCGVSVSLMDCTDDSIVDVFQMYIDIQVRCGVSVSLMDCTDDSIVFVFQMYIDIQARCGVSMYIDIQARCGVSVSLMDYPLLYQNNLMNLIRMEKFLELTLDELEVILRDPRVLVESEVDTLHAMASWVQYNPLERIAEVPRLLDFIIFEVISPDNISRIVQMYDPIFSEVGARNKISEVYRFHALQLSNKGDMNAGFGVFPQNIAGIEQDPLMDRVSYIPSQGVMAKPQTRPTLSRPYSSVKLEPAPGFRYSVRSSNKDGVPTPLICAMRGSAASNQSDRPKAVPKQISQDFSQNRTTRAPKNRGNSKRSNRSNNSVFTNGGERPRFETVSEKEEQKRSIKVNSLQDFPSGDAEDDQREQASGPSRRGECSDQTCGGRLTRRDLWLRVLTRKGCVKHRAGFLRSCQDLKRLLDDGGSSSLHKGSFSWTSQLGQWENKICRKNETDREVFSDRSDFSKMRELRSEELSSQPSNLHDSQILQDSSGKLQGEQYGLINSYALGNSNFNASSIFRLV